MNHAHPPARTHRYRSYGRVITSDRPLPLPAAENAPDPVVANIRLGSHGGDADATAVSYCPNDSIRVTVRDDHTVVLTPLEELSEDVLDHLTLDLAVPIAMTAWVAPVLHASAVVWGEEAVLFAANSGAGKSTLALACAREGARLLADDGVLIEPGSGEVSGQLSTLRLHPEQAAALLEWVPDGPVVTPTGKVGHNPRRLPIATTTASARAAALISIDAEGEPGAPPRLETAGAAESVAVIARALLAPPTATRTDVGRLDVAAAIAEHLPVMHLRYVRDLRLLPQVVALLHASFATPAS